MARPKGAGLSGPLPFRTERTGRKVTREHLFATPIDFTNGAVRPIQYATARGTGSWADALTRINRTGETLVIPAPEVGEAPDRKERRRRIKALHARIAKSALRRGLTVHRHWDGANMLFTVETE